MFGRRYRLAVLLLAVLGGHLDSAAATSPDNCRWFLVVARDTERQSIDDTRTPYRNSWLALYERDGAVLRLRESGLKVRSTSSAVAFPHEGDIPTIERYIREKAEPYRWGYASIPCGIYAARPEPWRNSNDTAFLLSDWPHTDGVVTLLQPQTLRAVNVERDERTLINPRLVETADPPIVSETKTECYLHPTVTRHWSHRDSYGCLNLFKPPGTDIEGEYDWDTMAGWFERHEVSFVPADFAVVIVDADTSPPALRSSAPPRDLRIAFHANPESRRINVGVEPIP